MSKSKSFKVYGSSPAGRLYVPESLSRYRQTRHIVAAASLTEACRLLKTSRAYTSETGNEDELRAALTTPGVVLWQTHRWDKVFEPVPSESARATADAAQGKGDWS